ncbi:Nucleotide-binding protein, UspA family [Natranaeroarchaeum sulfidigenes]|uniref:Nucleotide-binding protein, UspA family n=2 Tax=Natranaeroarchaeum sulfidigenes TaxID=2784880 RepID=A0A897MRP2_9EURY|nr:Nucleotide-binding protein, UspA family [Natranaeroarchaeum sulfidigenes]
MMSHVVVPVRYPLSSHSKKTLAQAIELAEDRDGDLSVLHVDLYQDSRDISRAELKRSVESEFGRLQNARYIVRKGFLVEETILEEIANEDADVVVIGHKQEGRWRRMIRKLVSDPDIESYLRQRLECELVVVHATDE